MVRPPAPSLLLLLLLLQCAAAVPRDYTGDGDARATVLERIPAPLRGEVRDPTAVVDKGRYRFLVAGRSVVGASWNPRHPHNAGMDDELAFAGFALQALALHATCRRFADSPPPAAAAARRPRDADAPGLDADTAALANALLVPCVQPQAPLRALVLGLGSGSVARYFSRRGVLVDIVERSSGVLSLTQRHVTGALQGRQRDGARIFPFDALRFLRRGRRKAARREAGYAFVVHDLFSGGKNALRTLTREVFQLIADSWLLKPAPDDTHYQPCQEHGACHGVLAVNFVGLAADPGTALGPAARSAFSFSRDVVARLRDVFPHVRCFRDLPADFRPAQVSNVCCFATEHERGISFLLNDPVLRAPADDFPTSSHLREFPLNEVFAAPVHAYDFPGREGDKDPTMKCLVRRQGPSSAAAASAGGERRSVPTCHRVGDPGATDEWNRHALSLTPEMEASAADWISAAMEKHAEELLSPAVLDEIVAGPSGTEELLHGGDSL